MAKSINLMSYRSTTGNILYHTPVFTYCIDVIYIHKKYIELLYSKYKYSIDPIKIKNDIIYKKYKDGTIATSIYLYGAPMHYLIKNNYKYITLEEYKETFKKRKKNGNKVYKR